MWSIEEFVDERQKSWCIHCAQTIAGCETNVDHVPSKSLLTKPRPHHLPTVTICTECNKAFSLDEQYLVTFLSCVLAGSADPEKQSNMSARRALVASPALRALIERARIDYPTRGGGTRTTWTPDLDRIKRVVTKNARGHAYFEFGEAIVTPPVRILAFPLEHLTAAERECFEGSTGNESIAPWPEVGSRMMTRLVTGQDMVDQWVVVQDRTYRYSVELDGGVRVRSVIWEYLGTEVLWQH